jgi:hypothetical protein
MDFARRLNKAMWRRSRLKVLCVYVGYLLYIIINNVSAFSQEIYNSYRIEVTFNPQAHTLQGTAIVKYFNDSDQPVSSIYFWLTLNQGQRKNPYLHEIAIDQQYWNGFDPAWTKIESVSTEAGERLSYELEPGPPIYPFQLYSLAEEILRVDLPQPLAPGSSLVIKIAFTSKAAHLSYVYTLLSGYKLGIYNWLWFWYPRAIPARELTNGRYFTSEKSYYPSILPASWHEVLLTVPKTFQVAAASDHQEVIREEDDWKTVRIHSDVPTRSAGFILSRDFRRYLLKSDIPIEVYYRPGYEGAARLLASYAAEILDYYRQHFGPYAYKRLIIVESPDWGYGNSAGDALVFMSRSHFDERDLLVPGAFDRVSEFGLAHEIAHMWWFLGVGLDADADLWISEGFADYLAFSYFEAKYGEFEANLSESRHQELLAGLVSALLGGNLRRSRTEFNYLTNIIKNRFDEALVKPIQSLEYLNTAFFKTYMKSVLVLRALRGLLGREQMEAAIRAAYKQYLHQSMTTEDFRAVVEQVSGRELKDFFQQWFYQDNPAPFVDYAVAGFQSRKRSDGQFVTEIQLLRQGTGTMPVAVTAIAEDDKEIHLTWSGEEANYVLTVESAHPIKRIQLDPQELTPDVNRFNNFYPRKWQVRWGSYSLSLDSYQIALSPLGIEGGFRLDHRWALNLISGQFSFNVDFGRRASLDGHLSANLFPSQADEHHLLKLPTQLDGELGLNWTRYEHPQIGLPGRFWEATDRWRLSLLGRLALQEEAKPSLVYVGLDYRRQETQRRRYSLWITLRQGLNLPFTRFTLGGMTHVRLQPNVYLGLQAELGFGLRTPELLQFDLQEMRSLQGATGFPYRSHSKLYSKAMLSFPILRDAGYSLANLVLLRRLDGNFFIALGDTSRTIGQLLHHGRTEAGVAVKLELSTLGGLFPFKLILGVAFPITGDAERRFTPYLDLELH